MIEFQWIFVFLGLGAVVGFMAGLLGIGGGGIMVPVLASTFLLMGVPLESVIHLALGTSMAAIIFTSLASLRAHHAKQAVVWTIVKAMVPGILLGTFLATFIVAKLSSVCLALFFAVFMASIALQMILNKTAKPSKQLAGNLALSLVASMIGAISALVSIGGGSMTVPYLTWQNISIRKAIGTSAAIGLPISISGTLGYLVNGWDSGSGSGLKYSYGFIYIPAVTLISFSSFFTAPLGAQVAHRLNVKLLKQVFALLLIGLSIKMFTSVL